MSYGIDLADVFRPGSTISARRVIGWLAELPDDSAFVASVRASAPPAAKDTAVNQLLRSRRRYRGWDHKSELVARVGDALTGNRWPRPFDGDDVMVGNRRVLDLDQMP